MHFSSNCIFQLLTTFSAKLFFFHQASVHSSEGRKKELARFQAPSLPICKPGLIWVSKPTTKVPMHITQAHSSDQTGLWLHISSHSNCVILKSSVMGNVWHDSNWEWKNSPCSVPSHNRWAGLYEPSKRNAFPGSLYHLRPFAKQALVSQHAFMHLQWGSAGCIDFLKLKLHGLNSQVAGQTAQWH